MPYCAYCGSDVRDPDRYICPSCNKPHSGAPATAAIAAPRSGSSPLPVLAIVLVGLFVVVGMMGIFAAIAIPNFLTAMERTKQKRSMADVRMIATASEAYATDHNRYPPPEQLEASLVPTYTKSLPARDGWGRAYRYDCWNDQAECDRYAIGSAGKDGRWENESLREYADHATTNFDCDIVFSNGTFVEYPEGIQSR